MSKKALSEARARVLKALGFEPDSYAITCSGRPGVVYIRQAGELRPLARDSKTMKPLQLNCEHEAVELIEQLYQVLFLQGLQAIMQGKEMPKAPDPNDFKYVYMDEEPEPEVTNTADADTLVARIKENL